MIALFFWPVFCNILLYTFLACGSLAIHLHAASTRLQRSCGLPVFSIGPSLSVWPLCLIIGQRPTNLPTSEEFLKRFGLKISVANCLEIVGPTPG